MADKEHLALIQQGVYVWNNWRKNNPETNPDLSDADFRGRNLSKANFSSTNLSNTYFNSASLNQANLTHTDLSNADFIGANLSSVDFSGADFNEVCFKGVCLKGANLSKANLTRVNFSEAYSKYGVSTVDLSNANLSNADLRRVNLQDANLSKANFSGANLHGAHLDGADLSGADLSGANLSAATFAVATLRDANLSRTFSHVAEFVYADLTGVNFSQASLTGSNFKDASLIRASLVDASLNEVQALGTCFYTANLTGACIEDWHINSATQLKGIVCDYVYLKFEQEERYPYSRNFVSGEFTKLFRKALETVELIFQDGINWEAFAYSFKKIEIENSDAQVDIQSIEKRGDGVLLVKVSVSANANKAKIHSEFRQGYELASKAFETQYEARLQDKDKHINQLVQLLQQSNEKLGEVPRLMVEVPKYDQRYSNFGSFVDTAQAGSHQQSIQYNYSPEQRQTLAETAEDIQRLLKQLEENNPTATEVEKQAFVNLAISPSRKQRFLRALQVGWQEALKEFFDNPYLNVGLAIIEGWKAVE